MLNHGISLDGENTPFTPKTDLLVRARDFGRAKHKGQTRHDKVTPYWTHTEETARIVQEEFKIQDEDIIVATLLHDVLEDTNTTVSEIESNFGNRVAQIVLAVSKLKSKDPDHERLAYYKQILEIGSPEPAVFVVKLADNCHNAKTLSTIRPEKRYRKALETLKIYAPLSESLGIWQVKTFLEDQGLKYSDFELYEKVANALSSDPRLQASFLDEKVSALSEIFGPLGGVVNVRRKGIWATEQKRVRTRKNDFRDINDVVSFRVVFPDITSKHERYQKLYSAASLLHEDKAFSSLLDPSRDDFFLGKQARYNGYQAVQRTISDPEVGAYEVAFVTKRMEERNDWGIISNMRLGKYDFGHEYKLSVVLVKNEDGERIHFIPEGNTVFDLAVSVDTHLAANATKALVNGKEVPLTSSVPHASQVTFITKKVWDDRVDKVALAESSAFSKYKMEGIYEELAREDLKLKGEKQVRDFLINEKLGILRLPDVEHDVFQMLHAHGYYDLASFYMAIGANAIDIDEISSWLTEYGITKEELKLTAVEIMGMANKNGLLQKVAKIINDLGGDIQIQESRVFKDNTFSMYFVSSGLLEKEDSLRTKLLEEIPGSVVNVV